MSADIDQVIAGLLGDLDFAAQRGNHTARERAAALKLRLRALSDIRTLANQQLDTDSREVRDWKDALREIVGLCDLSEST